MFNKKYRNDIFLVAIILLITLIVLVVFKLNQTEGEIVKVSIDGKTTHCYNLSDNIKTDIINGDNKNVLVIKDGQTFVESATCPDKICVAHRKISKTGETIVCLPHKLVIEITEK